MIRKSLAVLLLLLPAVPALARSDPDYYPMPCDVLWTAVKNTLNNQSDYGILAIDDFSYRASFVVVGDLTVYKDVVALRSKGNGCSTKLSITQVGSDNSNERGFRGRLRRTLAKMRKPPAPLSISGNSTASAAPAPSSTAPTTAAPPKPQSAPVTGIVWQSTVVSRLGVSHPDATSPDRSKSPAKPTGEIPVAGSGNM